MRILPIALLLMGRDRVVDEGLDTVTGEVLLKAVALVAKDGEEVVYVVLGTGEAGEPDERIGYTFII
jgi:hypothetical protein